MNHEQAFLDAIRQEPDDDVHRLIFADWLDERDDPRGAFIRCQVLAAQRPRADPERLALEEEARDHFDAHRQTWLTDLTPHLDAWDFQRGFVERITLPGAKFLALPPALFDRHPVREVHLTLEPLDRSPDDLHDLAACPHLRFVERLGLVHRFLTDAPVESLFASPHLTRLRGLVLNSTYLTGRWLGDVMRYPILRQVEELDLSYCPFLHDRALRSLLASPQAGLLRRLRVGATALTPYGLSALLTPHRLTRLVDLEMNVPSVSAMAEASRKALRDLAASPLVGQLQTLALRGGSLAGERGMLLFGAELEHVRELHITGCDLGEQAAKALADAPGLRKLTCLNLAHNRLGPEELAHLAASPILERVEVLDLGDNPLQGRGVLSLAQSPTLSRLAHLNLARNRVGGPSAHALAHAPLAAGLRWLNLSENYIGQVGVEGLVSSPHLTRLTHLDLSLNRLEPVCAGFLGRAANLAHLTTLDLSSNHLGDAGVQALARSPYLQRLRRLDLRYNQIGRSGVEALLASPALPRLEALDLRGNELCRDELPRLVARFGGVVNV